jgi:DNA-binding FadR family transcriptional regulator
MSDALSLTAPSRRVKTRRLVEQLHTLLERQIDEGRIKPGERLATERALAVQFSTSRNVVRAALEMLDKAGKITRRVGHGTVVTAPGVTALGLIAPGTARPSGGALPFLDGSPVELMEFRLAMEPGLAEAMTLHASERELRAIMDCVDRGDAAERWEEWEHWDRSFHQLCIAATHNRLAIAIYDAVIAVRHKQPWIRLKQGHTDRDKWRTYQSEHRLIAEALLARDARAAGEAIRGHLTKVRAKMLGY